MAVAASIDISVEDVDRVHGHVERCLLRYMTKEETMRTLSVQFQIPPCFTELVWERLEEENREFFRAYYPRLVVKNQILEFNRLIALQVEHMQRLYLLSSDGCYFSPTQQISSVSVENTRLPNGSSAQSSTQRINIDPSFMSQNGSSAQSSMQRNNIDPSFMSKNGSLAQSSTQRNNIDPSFMSQNGSSAESSMRRNNIDPSFKSKNGSLLAQSPTQRINIDPSFMSQNGLSAQSSMQRNNIDPSFMSKNGSLAQSSTQRIKIDPSFMSEKGNMGLAETMNRNIVITEADSSARHLIGRLRDNDVSAVESSAQATSVLDLINITERFPVSGFWPSGDGQRLDPASARSSHQNLGGDCLNDPLACFPIWS